MLIYLAVLVIMKRYLWLFIFSFLMVAISSSAGASVNAENHAGSDKDVVVRKKNEYPSHDLQIKLWREFVVAFSRKNGLITPNDYKKAFGVEIPKAEHQFDDGYRYEQSSGKDRFFVSLYIRDKYKGRYVGKYSSLIVDLTEFGRSNDCYKVVDAIDDLHKNGWVGSDGYTTGPGMPSHVVPVNLGNKNSDYQIILSTDITGCLYSVSVHKKPEYWTS